MLEKNGAITDQTPADEPQFKDTPPRAGGNCCGGRCKPKTAEDNAAAANDKSHPVTRVADAVKAASSRR